MKIETIKDFKGNVISERTYNEKGQLIETKSSDGSSSKRIYNKQGDIIYDEGIGNLSLKPYWDKWERYYNADGSKEVYHSNSSGYWYEERINKCGRVVDHINVYLAKAKNVQFRGEVYLYGNVISC